MRSTHVGSKRRIRCALNAQRKPRENVTRKTAELSFSRLGPCRGKFAGPGADVFQSPISPANSQTL